MKLCFVYSSKGKFCFHKMMVQRYTRMRIFLVPILNSVPFHCQLCINIKVLPKIFLTGPLWGKLGSCYLFYNITAPIVAGQRAQYCPTRIIYQKLFHKKGFRVDVRQRGFVLGIPQGRSTGRRRWRRLRLPGPPCAVRPRLKIPASG